MNLQCQWSGGRKPIKELSASATLADLRGIIFSITSIEPERQKLLSGFPPKEVVADDDSVTVSSLGIRNGDSLRVDVREVARTDEPHASVVRRNVNGREEVVVRHDELSRVHPTDDVGSLMRRVVQSDNSCLFNSIGYLLISRTRDHAPILRQMIAETVSADPLTYNEAFLAMPNTAYRNWILDGKHWGGAIEISILSKHFQTEIAAVDIQTLRIDRYGEDLAYKHRALLIYDGVHYDPLALSLFDGASEDMDVTVFPTEHGDAILAKAVALAGKERAQHHYTDVGGFHLRCGQCGTVVVGEKGAQAHAHATGHSQFGEVD
eukprot:Opistho-2@42876